MSFLLGLMAIIGALAMSQLLVHPTVQFALSDRKLDRGLAVAADAVRVSTDTVQRLWAEPAAKGEFQALTRFTA